MSVAHDCISDEAGREVFIFRDADQTRATGRWSVSKDDLLMTRSGTFKIVELFGDPDSWLAVVEDHTIGYAELHTVS